MSNKGGWLGLVVLGAVFVAIGVLWRVMIEQAPEASVSEPYAFPES